MKYQLDAQKLDTWCKKGEEIRKYLSIFVLGEEETKTNLEECHSINENMYMNIKNEHDKHDYLSKIIIIKFFT